MNTRKGFTLIELMVSVAIFTVVMTIALGSLLSIAEAERKAESIKAVINNLHFALDSMSRAIRTGYDYNCGGSGDCGGALGGTSLTFTDSQGRTVTYCRGTGNSCNATGVSILQNINGAGNMPITAPEVVLENFAFYVIGTNRTTGSPSDTLQPRVTITLSGTVSSSTTQGHFDIQTSITQRLYDL